MLSYMGDLMPIGEFSVRSGLSQKRLRSYAAAGVLVPAAVDSDSGYRYYAQSQLSSALLIDALRKAEIPLSDITEILREPRAFDFDRWLLQLESDTAARRAGLEAALRLITNEHNSRDRKGTTGTMLEAAGRTETGPVRRTNQDAPIIGDRIVGVADGMGGAPAGEIASALAATILERAFAGTGADELSALVRAANAAIFARAAADPALTGMGTTLCCAGFLDDGRVTVVNVGDSRAYVLRAGVLRQVTTDHTVTAELVLRGQLDGEAAVNHPHRHVLTRVLGVGPTVVGDTVTIEGVDGDVLILCTDGLYNTLAHEELAELAGWGGTPAEIADRLVERAVAEGAHDNVTAVVVGLATPPPAREVALRRRDHQPRIGATRWLDGAAAFVM